VKAVTDRVKDRGAMNMRFVAAIGGVALVALAVVLWRHYAASESTDDAQVDGHIHPVATRVGGTVQQVLVRDNQQVTAGTVLVQIDPTDLQVALQRAQADLADAHAAADAARSGVPVTSASTTGQLGAARAGIQQSEAAAEASDREAEAARARRRAAEARVRQATVEAERLARDRERLEPLVAKDEVSRQHYDAVVAAAEAARAAAESAAAALAEADQGIAVAESRRAQTQGALARARADLLSAGSAPDQVSASRSRASAAEARVKLAEAVLRQAELNLGYATIKAMVNGVVSRRTVEVGQVIQPGQALMALVSLDDLWVVANFKETQLEGMSPGQAATIKVDALSGTLRGKVDSIGAATGAKFSLLPPDNATGNYVKVVQRVPVKIVLDPGQDPGRALRPGLSVVASISKR
jgi:membrane fusion protein (multidrug efflux system)